MPTRIFAITAPRDTVTLDNEGRAEVSFTASNTGPKSIAGRAKLVPLGSTKTAWLSLDGEQERNFAKGEAHQLSVHIAVPPGTPVGKYSFRLNIISVENPDDEFTEGPSVSFEVKELTVAQAPARKFPWWIVVTAGVLVLGGGLITWVLMPEKITMPDVVGRPYQEAVNNLNAVKLKPAAKETKVSGTQKPGIVIEQNPKAKEVVRVGSEVNLVVEGEPELVTVPDVIGVPVEKVGPMLKGVKLRLRTEPKSFGEKPGTIVDQNPKKDERVAPGTVITAFVEPASQILRGHGDMVNGVAISDRWLVTRSADKMARLWDLSAKDPAANPVVLRGHQESVWGAAISPNNHWVVTGSADHTARLWDLSAKDPAANPVVLRGHERPIWAVAISDRWVVTGSEDHTARLWDLSARDPAANPVVLRGHEALVYAVAISPDNHWVVTGSADNTARLWDLGAKDPAANPVVLRGHEQAVYAVAISPNSRWVVTGSGDKTVRLWDLSARDPAVNPVVLAGHEGGVTKMAISPDNHWLVTGGPYKTARLWDLSAKDPAANPVVLRGHQENVTDVAISDRWVVTGSVDKTARLWDLSARDPAANPVVLRGHEGSVWAVAISPDNHWLVTGSTDHTARLWDLRKLTALGSPGEVAAGL